MTRPELPTGIEWGDRTPAWWKSLDTVPGVDTWSDADWGFALDTALVHRAVWMDGDLSQLKELRMREQSMGITPSARKTSNEVAVEKIIETPLQRIVERRVERKGIEESKPASNVSTPSSKRGTRKS